MTMRNPGHCSQSRTYPPLAHRAATVRGTWLRGQGADKSGCGYNGTLRKLRWACPLDFGAKTLGAAILGIGGDEIIHSVLDVMYADAPYTVIQRATHIHPTVTELIPTMLGDLKPLE